MAPIIEVRDLKRDYVTAKGWVRRKKEIVHAVNGITFEVNKGEIFGLLGQNGAGKTTTIKMLITLLAPTSGICRVLGYRTFGEEKEIRNRINFIFGGEMGVYRRLSARDNLKYFANLYHIDSDTAKKRIDSILNLVGLSEKADLLAETYSKGMIQRLQIARGLINDPEIIFMDEPTVGLDPLGARMLRDIIRTLREQGKTVLLTTHYMYEADELCDRIAIINKGRLIALDTPGNLKHKVMGAGSKEAIIRQPSEKLAGKIESISGVTCVTASEREEGTCFNIQFQTNADISSDLFELLKNEKIYSFVQKEVTLEDAYIKMVEEG